MPDMVHCMMRSLPDVVEVEWRSTTCCKPANRASPVTQGVAGAGTRVAVSWCKRVGGNSDNGEKGENGNNEGLHRTSDEVLL